MATIIDALVVTLGLDSSGFKKGQKEVGEGLKDTKNNADQTAKDMEAAGKRAASFFGSIRTELLALVGVTLSAAGVKSFISSMTNDLMRLGVESKALDMSAKSLDGWERAAAAAGSTAEKMSSTLGTFQRSLTNYRTGGAQDDPMFGALANFGAATGANFDFDKDNSEAIMRKIAQNWNKLSEDAKRRFGSMLGFDNATQQAMSSGQLVNDANRFTQISKATDDATQKALEFNRRLEEMKQNFSAAAQVLYEALIPYIEKLIPLIEKFGIWIATHGPEIERFFAASAREINGVVNAVGGWQNAMELLLAYVAGRWVLGMLGAFNRVGAGISALGKLGIAGGVIYGASEYADYIDKNSGPKKELSENGLYYKDSWVGQGWQWVKDTFGSSGANYYDAYGTQPRGGAGKLSEKGRALLGFMSTQFAQLEAKYSLPDGLLRSVAATESAGNQFAIGPKTKYGQAKGLFQFMDGTAKSLGLSGNDVFDPTKSAEAAAKYMRQLLNMTGGNLAEAVGAYNWGIGNVQRKGLGNAPMETQDYIPKVLGGIQLGAGASAMGRSPYAYQQSGSPKNEFNIGEVNVNSSATTMDALGTDIQNNAQRNRLVTPFLSGQGG